MSDQHPGPFPPDLFLDIVEICRLNVLEDGRLVRSVPGVLVDARQRPDVVDLERVLNFEGRGPTHVGDIRFAWQTVDLGHRLQLFVIVRSPAPCRFGVSFDLGDDGHRRLLRQVAQVGVIAVCPGSAENPGGFTVHIDPVALAGLLDSIGVGADDE